MAKTGTRVCLGLLGATFREEVRAAWRLNVQSAYVLYSNKPKREVWKEPSLFFRDRSEVMKTIFAFLFIVPAVLAQNCTSGFNCAQTLNSSSVSHDHYLFNASWSYDQKDTTVLPWEFYWNNALQSPSLG